MITSEVSTAGYETFAAEAVRGIRDPKLRQRGFRAVALKFASMVIADTPVDTGQARGGWQAVPGAGRLATGGTSAGRAEGRSKSSYKERLSGTKPEIEITNGVRHITFLELGSSQQAPAGFIRLNLRKITGDLVRENVRSTEAAIRLANIKARRAVGLRQGLGIRGVGRAQRR